MNDVPAAHAAPEQPRSQARSLGQLRWRCRRGMKELDVLLGRFVDEEWSSTSVADQESFWRLLDSQDTTLYAYFLGNERPAAVELAALVDRIAGRAGRRNPRPGA